MTELKFDMGRLSSTDIEVADDDFLAIITETCFFLPVRLIVDNKDVFQIENVNTNEISNWIELPAFSLLLDWKESLSKLSNAKATDIFLADAGQMKVSNNAGKVTVTTNFNDVISSADYSEFYSALIKGIECLRDELKYKFPELFKRKELQV